MSRCGGATLLNRPHDPQGYGAWLNELSDGLGAPDTILGHSFGSLILSFAIGQGLDCRRCVLVNPIAEPALHGPRRIATALVRGYYALAKRLPEAYGARLLSSRTLAMISSEFITKTRDPDLRRWIRSEHRRHADAFANRDVVLEAFAASTSTTVCDYASQFRWPTLIVGSDRDDLSSEDACRRLENQLPEGALHLIRDGGHLLPYEAPRAIVAAIRAHDRDGPSL